MKTIIKTENLSIDFFLERDKEILHACDEVSLDIYEGEVLGVIGESGSGKSTLASGILNLVSKPGKIVNGDIFYYTRNEEKVNLMKMSTSDTQKFRWQDLATVFQAAQNSLNPTLKIQQHFIETVEAHNLKISRDEILERAKKNLDYVRLEPGILDYFPYQLSGGMKQRVLIALSLILNPRIILLDEPTTALDVVTQHYILNLLNKIHKELNITLVFFTHDIALISSMVDKIAVMYAGQIVEYGVARRVFTEPAHPYTDGLVNAIPTLKGDLSTRKAISGNPPNLTQNFSCCKFTERCDLFKSGVCDKTISKEKTRVMYDIDEKQSTRCYVLGIKNKK